MSVSLRVSRRGKVRLERPPDDPELADRAAAACRYLGEVAALLRGRLPAAGIRLLVVLTDRCDPAALPPLEVLNAHAVLAPTKPTAAHEVLLMPDFYFITSRGHAGLREYVAAHAVPWDAMRDAAVWRGRTTGHRRPGRNHRIRFVRANHRHGDILFSGVLPQHTGSVDPALVGSAMPVKDCVRCRYQVDVDGHSSSWDGLIWKLLSGCLVLKVKSDQRQWYYDRLKPWVHYVPCTAANFAERLAWCRERPELCRAIAEAGRRLATELTYDAETATFAARLLGRV